MNADNKSLFKLWGRIWWLDKNDRWNFFFIPKDTKNPCWFKHAPDKKTVIRLFKREIGKRLKQGLSLDYLPRFHHIVLDRGAEIEKIKKRS